MAHGCNEVARCAVGLIDEMVQWLAHIWLQGGLAAESGRATIWMLERQRALLMLMLRDGRRRPL